MTAAAQPDILFPVQLSFGTADERRQVIALVGSILGDVLTGFTGPKCTAVNLEPLGGGRSGSYVFKATPLAHPDQQRRGAPVVVKISPLGEGSREKANYDRFVRPFLPAECRPDLLDFAAANGRAALCYSFVGDGGRPETLTGRLAAGDLAALDRVLAMLFEGLHQSWYGSRQIEAEADLARYYLGRYFDGPITAAEAENRLLDCATRYFGARPLAAGCMIGATAFPSIRGALFSSPTARGYRSCIIHGDLNSDNVIVGPKDAPVRLIDFPRTGRGHVYQDFVSLEASVRINYPSTAPYGDILKIERLIARGEPGIPAYPYAVAIGNIRETARRLFGPEEKPAAYHFAVAAVGLRLMQAADLSDAARARISASALWAAKVLAEV